MFWVALATPLACHAAAIDVIQVASSGGHALILLEDGSVAGWGNNYSGQLANAGEPLPKERHVLKPAYLTLPGKVRQLSVSAETSFAVLEDGSVWSWGRGIEGLLGNGDIGLTMRLPQTNYPGTAHPQQVIGATDVTQVVSNNTTVLALRRDGTVLAWGKGDSALLGAGSFQRPPGEGALVISKPVVVSGLGGITRLALGTLHALALTKDGRVLSWGSNSSGALGRQIAGKTDRSFQYVEALESVTDIAAGGGTSAAITRDGSVWVWGSNLYGHLATGKTAELPEPGSFSQIPLRVGGISQAVSVQIGSPGRHTVVRLKDGSLRAWGNSDWGQVGAGVSGRSQPSVQNPRISSVKSFWASGNNTFAVKSDGSFWIWGDGMLQYEGATGVLGKNQKVPTLFALTIAPSAAPGNDPANSGTQIVPRSAAPQPVTPNANSQVTSATEEASDTMDMLNKGMNVFRMLKGF